jgi:hypothetical protein
MKRFCNEMSERVWLFRNGSIEKAKPEIADSTQIKPVGTCSLLSEAPSKAAFRREGQSRISGTLVSRRTGADETRAIADVSQHSNSHCTVHLPGQMPDSSACSAGALYASHFGKVPISHRQAAKLHWCFRPRDLDLNSGRGTILGGQTRDSWNGTLLDSENQSLQSVLGRHQAICLSP